jgi:DNA-binding cell septation regulator SpoVG
MKVINIKPYNKGKLRAFFDVLTAEGFTIKGFKIMEGINGEFVSRPSQQDKNGEWYDTVYCTKEMSSELLKIAKAQLILPDGKNIRHADATELQDVIKNDLDVPEIPQMEGTREQLDNLKISDDEDIPF